MQTRTIRFIPLAACILCFCLLAVLSTELENDANIIDDADIVIEDSDILHFIENAEILEVKLLDPRQVTDNQSNSQVFEDDNVSSIREVVFQHFQRIDQNLEGNLYALFKLYNPSDSNLPVYHILKLKTNIETMMRLLTSNFNLFTSNSDSDEDLSSLPWEMQVNDPRSLSVSKRTREDLDGLVELLMKLSHAVLLESSNTTQIFSYLLTHFQRIIDNALDQPQFLSAQILSAHVHYLLAKIHLGSILPFFPVQYEDSHKIRFWTWLERTVKWGFAYSIESIFLEDWMIELTDAIQCDIAADVSFYDRRHYLPPELTTFNPELALFHLKQASIVGHPSSQSLLAVIADMILRVKAAQVTSNSSNYSTPQLETQQIGSSIYQNRRGGSMSYTPPASSNQNNASFFKLPFKMQLEYLRSTVHTLVTIAANSSSPSAILLKAYQSNYGIDSHVVNRAYARKLYSYLTYMLTKSFIVVPPPPPNRLTSQIPILLEHEAKFNIYRIQNPKLSSLGIQSDIIQYYRYQADIGNLDAAAAMGINFLREHHLSLLYPPKNKEGLNANLTDPRLRAYLGYMYEHGLGVHKQDLNYAIELYQSALDNEFALRQLGFIALNKNSPPTKQDIRTALKFFHKAADLKDAHSMYTLGRIYLYGLYNVSIDIGKAFHYLMLATQNGHIGAVQEIAKHAANYDKALPLYEKILQTTIYTYLSHRAHEFYHSSDKLPHALFLYNLASAIGDPISQCNAGYMYHMQQSRLNEHKEQLLDYEAVATILLPMSSDCASLLTRYSINVIYQNPLNIFLATEQAKITECSCERVISLTSHDSLSENSSSKQYHENYVDHNNQDADEGSDNSSIFDVLLSAPLNNLPPQLILENNIHSLELYKSAAQLNSSLAFLKLGQYYYHGIGTKADWNVSFSYYFKACLAKDVYATFNVGLMYQRGHGVSRDYKMARRYYNAASTLAPEIYLVTKVAQLVMFWEQLSTNQIEPSWDEISILVLSISIPIVWLIQLIVNKIIYVRALRDLPRP